MPDDTDAEDILLDYRRKSALFDRDRIRSLIHIFQGMDERIPRSSEDAHVLLNGVMVVLRAALTDADPLDRPLQLLERLTTMFAELAAAFPNGTISQYPVLNEQYSLIGIVMYQLGTMLFGS